MGVVTSHEVSPPPPCHLVLVSSVRFHAHAPGVMLGGVSQSGGSPTMSSQLPTICICAVIQSQTMSSIEVHVWTTGGTFGVHQVHVGSLWAGHIAV
jgi:hypothetical protein